MSLDIGSFPAPLLQSDTNNEQSKLQTKPFLKRMKIKYAPLIENKKVCRFPHT